MGFVRNRGRISAVMSQWDAARACPRRNRATISLFSATDRLEVGTTTDSEARAKEFDVVIGRRRPWVENSTCRPPRPGSIPLWLKSKPSRTKGLHRGCIPAKEFLENGVSFPHRRHREGVRHRRPSAFDRLLGQPRPQAEVVDQLFRGLSGLLKHRTVTTVAGVGQLQADHSVRVTSPDGATTVLRGKNIVLAAGSVPRSIPGFDIDGERILSSDEVLELSSLPKSVAVIGCGADRMRVRLDDVGPRLAGDDARGAADDPAGL